MSRSSEYSAIEKQLALLSRREPEFRMHPEWSLHVGPAKLLGVVANTAVWRRPGAQVQTASMKTWDSWAVVDKDGAPV